MGSSKQVVRRDCRAFSAECKAEAARIVAERRPAGASLTRIGRELDVRRDQLRAWARGQREAHGTGARPTSETPEERQLLQQASWQAW